MSPRSLEPRKNLKDLGVFHVLYGLRPLPLYGVPYVSRDLVFAVKTEKSEIREIKEYFSAHGFEPMPLSRGELMLLDLQNNREIKLIFKPGPLEWDDQVVDRSFEKRNVRILSVEDYVVSLLSEKSGAMMLELSAKTIYANMNEIDRDYLEDKASKVSVKNTLDELIAGLESASRR